jgi:hypothetical protein
MVHFHILHRVAALSGCIKNYSQSTTLDSALYWDYIIFCTNKCMYVLWISLYGKDRNYAAYILLTNNLNPRILQCFHFKRLSLCCTTAATSVAFHKSSKSQFQILYLCKFYRPSKITTNLTSRFLSLMNTSVTLNALEQEYATPTLIDTMFWTLSQQHLACCPMNFEYKFERKWKKVIGGWEHSVNGDLSFILLPSNIIQVTQFGRIWWVGRAAYMEGGGGRCNQWFGRLS